MDGLGHDEASAVVVPSGWSPVALIDHLRGAEQHSFGRVVSGEGGQGDADRAPQTLRLGPR